MPVLTNDITDADCIAGTLELFRLTPRPIHSNFLVAATVLYTDAAGHLRTAQGVNSETCVLSSCICAERTALVQLRLFPWGWRHINAVYITSSAPPPTLVSPGLLCREFMAEFSPAAAAVRERLTGSGGGVATAFPAPPTDVTVVLLSCDGAHEARHTLSALFPFPSLYHGVPHAHLAAVGASFAGFATPVTEASLAAASPPPQLAALLPAAAALHKEVATLAAKPHGGDALYPIHLAAGALLSDGSIILARQLKGLEYGCSADAVVRLSGALGGGGAGALTPLLVVQADQFGNCPAPSAPARSLLCEHASALNAKDLVVLVHAGEGRLRFCSHAQLSPLLCEISTGTT